MDNNDSTICTCYLGMFIGQQGRDLRALQGMPHMEVHLNEQIYLYAAMVCIAYKLFLRDKGNCGIKQSVDAN